MNNFKLSALVLSALALTFASCTKEEPTSSETMYILGSYNSETFLMTNDKIQYLQSTDGGVVSALDMVISDNGDSYIVGEEKLFGEGMPPQSILYKNNVQCDEYTFDGSSFCSIALKENGEIVLAGLDLGRPAVWDGTTENYLPLGIYDDITRWDVLSIDYVDGNEFILGENTDDYGFATPVVWMNRQLVDLGKNGNASTSAITGVLSNGKNFKFAGRYIDPDDDDNMKAYEYNSQQHSYTQIPYQWSGSNISEVNGLVKSSKWNDTSGSVYSLVTEYYEKYHPINPETGEIDCANPINGGFYILKDGKVMPETIYKHPNEHILASITDMTMNSKGEIVLAGSLFDNEYHDLRPAYWVNGECHIINPDRREDGGFAFKVIIKNTRK